MLINVFLVFTSIVIATRCDPAGDQIETFKNCTRGAIAVMTTATGAPIYRQDTNTLNKRLIFNEYFMESMTHLDRERIPARVVHAKGAGAFGYFELSHDVTDICKANFLSNVGKRTPVAVRFSSVLQDIGGVDTSRESRGFAIKFYSEEGNFDIIALDIPAFVFRDPILFPSFVHAIKRNPATNLYDPNMLWDFITLNPESLYFYTYIFGDRGVPDGYRYMPGFSIHTYQVVNELGVNNFVRFHILPDLGLRSLGSDEAIKITGVDQDYSTRDLYNAIDSGNFPTWTVAVQALSIKDVKNAEFDVFDVTKELPLEKYPLRILGRLVLDTNPINYFAEIEQLAFSPSNLVPGILGAPDKVFEARRLSYRDAHNSRLGANFFNIPVNCPFQTTSFTYYRDGRPPVRDNMRDSPNYYPNSFHGPIPRVDRNNVELIEIYEELPNTFKETRERYVFGMCADERKRLVDNILYSLRDVATFLQERVINLFTLVHKDLGERIRDGLYGNSSRCDLPTLLPIQLKWEIARVNF